MADSAISHILNMYRQTANLAASVASGHCIQGPDAIAEAATAGCGHGGARRVRGETLGIVGMGRIGTATVLRAKTFGFDIIFYDPFVPAGLDKALGLSPSARCGTFHELLERADCVSLHAACSEVRCLFTAEANATVSTHLHNHHHHHQNHNHHHNHHHVRRLAR